MGYAIRLAIELDLHLPQKRPLPQDRMEAMKIVVSSARRPSFLSVSILVFDELKYQLTYFLHFRFLFSRAENESGANSSLSIGREFAERLSLRSLELTSSLGFSLRLFFQQGRPRMIDVSFEPDMEEWGRNHGSFCVASSSFTLSFSDASSPSLLPRLRFHTGRCPPHLHFGLAQASHGFAQLSKSS